MALSLVPASRSVGFFRLEFKFLAWRCARILYCLRNKLKLTIYCVPGRDIRYEILQKKKFLHTRQFIAPPCAIKGEKQFAKAGRSRCPGSTPWANLGSIDEVAEVKLLILKICGLDIYGLVWKCAPLCEFLCFVLLFVVGCCVLSVHLINPDYFEKAIWFSCCLFGVISFPCGRRVLFIPQDKKQSVVCGCLVWCHCGQT